MGIELGTDVTAASAAAAVLADDEELSYQPSYVSSSSGTELVLGGAAPAAITRKLQTVLSMRLDQGQVRARRAPVLRKLTAQACTVVVCARGPLNSDADKHNGSAA